jgi:hypothetical protein
MKMKRMDMVIFTVASLIISLVFVACPNPTNDLADKEAKNETVAALIYLPSSTARMSTQELIFNTTRYDLNVLAENGDSVYFESFDRSKQNPVRIELSAGETYTFVLAAYNNDKKLGQGTAEQTLTFEKNEVFIALVPLPAEVGINAWWSIRLDELSCSVTCGEVTRTQVLTDDPALRGGKVILHIKYGAQERENFWPQYIIARLLGANDQQIAKQRLDFSPTSSEGEIPAIAHNFVWELGEQAMNVDAVELTLYDGDYKAYINDIYISFVND